MNSNLIERKSPDRLGHGTAVDDERAAITIRAPAGAQR
jgi:hypothetical protein